MVLIGDAVKLQRKADVAETGLFGRAGLDGGAAVLQFHRAFHVGIQQVIANCILHRAVARYAVFVELHLDDGLLASLVEPVGMTGHGDPQVVTAVRIVLCVQRDDTEQTEKDNK